MLRAKGRNMDNLIQLDIKENSKGLLKLFWDHYKNHRSFWKRKCTYFMTSFIFSLIFIIAFYIDFQPVFFSKLHFIFGIVMFFLVFGGLVLPGLSIWLEVKALYFLYNKMKKILYAEGTYIEKIIFSSHGIGIHGYRDNEIMIKNLNYNEIALNFKENGIILQVYESGNYLYIPRKQIQGKNMKKIKKWYEEY